MEYYAYRYYEHKNNREYNIAIYPKDCNIININYELIRLFTQKEWKTLCDHI
jgi:hypothetical protein